MLYPQLNRLLHAEKQPLHDFDVKMLPAFHFAMLCTNLDNMVS